MQQRWVSTTHEPCTGTHVALGLQAVGVGSAALQ